MSFDEAPDSHQAFNTAAREWIDWHWRQLDGRIGRRVMETCTVVLPITEHFPESISSTRDGAQRVLDRLREFLRFPDPIVIEVFQLDAILTQGVWEMRDSGYYVPASESADGVARIWIEERVVNEGAWLVAFLAQILCRQLLGPARPNVIEPAEVGESEVAQSETMSKVGLSAIWRRSMSERACWSPTRAFWRKTGARHTSMADGSNSPAT